MNTTYAYSPATEPGDATVYSRNFAHRLTTKRTNHLVIVDSHIDEMAMLLSGLKAGYQVETLNPNQAGLEQVSQILRRYRSLKTLHIVAHGRSGETQLGNSWLTLEIVVENEREIARWSDSLAEEASVLFYGCEVARGDRGQAFVGRMQSLLRSNVQASKFLVGNKQLGGQWQIGETSAKNNLLAFKHSTRKAYSAVLSDPTHSLSLIPEFSQIGTDLEGELATSHFGRAVALSADGQTVAIGDPLNSDNGSESGHVRILRNVDGSWEQIGADIDGENVDDQFGYSVALSADGSTVAARSSGGAVRLFRNVEDNWEQSGPPVYVNSYSEESSQALALSADGNFLIVGSTDNTSEEGYVELFSNYDGIWYPLNSPVYGEYGNTGDSVAMSADSGTIAIGAPNNDNNGYDSGHVRIYRMAVGADGWQQIGADIDGEANYDQFGSSVALSADGNILAVGATEHDLGTGDGSDNSNGSVRLFRNVEGSWQQIGDDIDSEASPYFARNSVSLSADGSTLAVGTLFLDTDTGKNSRKVRIYLNLNDSWQQVSTDLEFDVTDNLYEQSISLSADGSTLAIGAVDGYTSGDDSGYVQIFNVPPLLSVEEDSSINLNGIGISGTTGDYVRTELSVINGRITIEPAWDFIIEYMSSDADMIVLHGTQSEINTALSTLTYYGNEDFFGSETLTISTDDYYWGGPIITDTVNIYVTPINEAPIASGSATLSPILEDTTDPAGATVRELFAANFDDSIDSLPGSNSTDNFAGIAIVANMAAATEGRWQRYTYDEYADYGEWTALGWVSPYDAVVLSATDRLRFVPEENFSGSVGGLRVHLVDESINDFVDDTLDDMPPGTYDDVRRVDISYPQLVGGSTPFSEAFVDLTTEITSVEDTPIQRMAIDLIQFQKIGEDIDGVDAGDEFGYSVSLSADGQIMAVGSRFNDDNGLNSGHVRIFQNNNGNWEQIGADINGEKSSSYSGWSISLSADGSMLAVGAPYNTDNGTQSGQVRVYQNNNGNWDQVGIDINGGGTYGRFGRSVSLSADGNTLAVGASGSDNYSGKTQIYRNVNNLFWEPLGGSINGEADYDYSGSSVSLSADGNTVAIGAPQNDNNGYNSGNVRIYRYSSDGWTQVGTDIEGEASSDNSGSSVSLSADGNVIAIGARYNDGENGDSSGHVRIYRDNNGSWDQVGSDIDGEDFSDFAGWSVSLSDDGNTVAIGARYNSGEDGENRGHVRVYRNNNDIWKQLSSDIDGEANYDSSGWSVSLSPDGSTVAVGAIYNDGNGTNSGHVRVYSLPSETLSVMEDEVVSLSGITVSDGDGNLSTTTVSVNHGLLNLDVSSGVVISAGANNSNTLTLSGNEAQINAALSTLTYKSNNFFGTETLTVTSTDSAGVPLSTTNTVNIEVLEVLDNLVVNTLLDETDGSVTDEDVSLRDAIAAIADGGTITFASKLADQTLLLNGSEIVLDKSLTIDGNSDITIDAQGLSRIFMINDTDNDVEQSVSLSGLTLTGGYTGSNESWNDDGGAIWNRESLTLTESTITGNTASDDGGGIRNDGTLSISRSTISNNTSIGTSNLSGGGGIINTIGSNLTVTETTLSGNIALNGGGLRNDGTLTLKNSTLSNNNANGAYGGGGLVNIFGFGTSGNAQIINTTISGNSAESAGGALSVAGGQVDIRNSTLVDNTAATFGGGISATGIVNLSNTILAGNNAATGANGYTADVPSFGLTGAINGDNNNLVTDLSGVDNGTLGSGSDIVLSASTSLNRIVRTKLADNGGFTKTHALVANSAAIDAGNNAIAIDESALPLTNDQRGESYVRLVATVDIGAVETGSKGTTDADTIAGSDGNDALFGGDGDDLLSGEGGNDVLRGGQGRDTLDGGAGLDMLSYQGSSAGVMIDLLNNVASGGDAEGDTIVNFERVSASNFDDILIGDDTNNLLLGKKGDDSLSGGDGNDVLQGGQGADTLDGGAGVGDMLNYRGSSAGVTIDLFNNIASGGDAEGDTIINFERVSASNFDDILTGDDNNNLLLGQAGDDSLSGGDGNDVLRGGQGADTLDGGAGVGDMLNYRGSSAGVTIDLFNNIASGGDAEGDTIVNFERVSASNFDDILTGDDNNNLLDGFDGADILMGLGGNDVLQGGQGADTLDGGAGTGDTLSYRRSTSGVMVNLSNNSASGGDAEGDTISNFERIYASNFDDVLSGSEENNILSGYSGDDTISGLDGNDVLRGGLGADMLLGGGGRDTFVFTSLSDSTLSAYDSIADLAIGTDRIKGVVSVAAGSISQVGSVSSLEEVSLSAVLTANVFAANSAAVFTVGNSSNMRSFLAINDSATGFQESADAVIEITGFSGSVADLNIS
ncbi:MAG: DUF4347 domain-containing protein [Cyanobacteria bacterium J06621_11]